MLLLVVFVAIFSAQFADAASCWNGTLTWVNQMAVGFTASNGAVTNRTFLLPTNATAKNQYMALALTAIASGKPTYLCVTAATAKSLVTGLQVKQ